LLLAGVPDFQRRGVVREREMGSVRVMRELSAERGGREHCEVCREREREKILVKFF
jgi:hypothetical protein